MRMLVARAKSAVCVTVMSGLISRCALVERFDALGQRGQQASVPTVNELRSQV